MLVCCYVLKSNDYPMVVSVIFAEIYTLDMIASGRGEVTMVNRLLKELEIDEEPFARVEEHLTRRNVTLREIFDSNYLRYNQIRAVIVALMFGVHP